MKKEKKVTLKVVDSSGHSTFSLTPSLALEKVREETQENGKWCYCNGNFLSSDTITLSDIEKAEEIVLTSALLGGETY